MSPKIFESSKFANSANSMFIFVNILCNYKMETQIQLIFKIIFKIAKIVFLSLGRHQQSINYHINQRIQLSQYQNVLRKDFPKTRATCVSWQQPIAHTFNIKNHTFSCILQNFLVCIYLNFNF